MNHLPTFSVGPQRPAPMATYDRRHSDTPIHFSLSGFVAGLVAGILLNFVLRALV